MAPPEPPPAPGTAIRRALEDQLGLNVEAVTPFGLAGSAGSTPLRITVKGDPPTYRLGKLYARSHLRADRWYKLGRELLYGRLEDEKPFHTVLPARPRRISIQRWSTQRVGLLLLTALALVVLAKVASLVLVNNDVTTTTLEIRRLGCDRPEPLWLQAQSVPSAWMVPCLNPLPPGWTVGGVNVRDGWSKVTLDHDRVGSGALVVRLAATCDTTGATPQSTGPGDAVRYERLQPGPRTWYVVFPGGCVTAALHPGGEALPGFAAEGSSIVGVTSRRSLDEELGRRSGGRLHLDET